MRSFRKWCIAGCLLSAVAMHAELSEWVQHLAVDTGLRGVFFLPMELPGGPIDGRRPPRETRAALTERIAAAPKDAALYRLRAGEAELALDFPAAEADWREYATLTGDRIALADYYHRRLQPAEEIAALDQVATAAAFERAIAEAAAQDLPVTTTIGQYRAWVAKFPQDTALRKRFIGYLTAKDNFTAAEREIAAYRQAFPQDESILTEEVALTMRRGTVNQAIAVFDQAFRPLMPADLLKSYFDLLNGQGRLRDFLAQARSAAAAQPEALDPAARMFHYYQHQQNAAAARRVLLEYSARKKNWRPEELYDTAKLFETIGEWDEAARHDYALYSLPASDDAARERGLAGLAHVLLTAPEQTVRYGAGDLSLYKDIATMDPHPGFLNGILSLVLNTSSPEWRYQSLNQASAAYFHRARASELLDLLDAKFPRAAEAPELHAQLIEAYAIHGDSEGVVRVGRKFLAAYPKAVERRRVALAMADALARTNRTAEEFAIYDLLLNELPVEQAEYLAVFDRYVARLVALGRLTDALALYRREIGRNPKDASLYEKLAAFLDQNRLGGQVEQVYKEAAAKFPDGTWHEKLARWYLRYRRSQDFAELTRQVVRIFSGTELEKYFAQVVNPTALDPVLYRQVNLFAHDRFPDNLTFVRNLLAVYARRETADSAAYWRLVRSYWYYDGQLRAQLFQGLSQAGSLDRELAAAASANPAAARFRAEGEAWRGHFEAAAPLMRATAAEFPGDGDVVLRAATLERSLGRTDSAAALARNLSLAAPRDRDALARIGDIYADRERFARAAPYWNRMPLTEPGNGESWLEAATVFWDYYKYDDALRLIAAARARLKQPALYAYEAGAIYEGKREYANAVRQYAKGAEPGSQAEARLLHLARSAKYRAVVDSVTASAALPLRAAVLEAEQRSADLAALLKSRAAAETSGATLEFIQSAAARLGLAEVEELALGRQAEVTHDPVERIRLRLALARLEESHGRIAQARSTMEQVERDNPAVLGVVRAATDFYWRNHLPDQAIGELTGAAARANAEYRKQFLLEAARKATEARQFAQARQLLSGLLANDRFDAQYLSAMADTFAQAGDDRGLRDFYTASIDAMKRAQIPADALRRGLIPALTRLGQQAQAVDEYIELINRYPEDQGLIREAAGYASQHQLGPRLTAYYTKAAADSPKDYRWPMVLARLATHFENFDAAIAAYTRAIAVRPDRIDLYLGRGALEARLMRFAEAEQTYGKVWELSYRDPQWLDQVAELQVREGKTEAAVATLRKAYLEGRAERPDLLLAIADRLERWGLVEQALGFARQAAQHGIDEQCAEIYARLLTRVRRTDEVFATMADQRAAHRTMAEGVALYYSPEEKAAFRGQLEKQPGEMWIWVAQSAGLYDLQAQWLAAGQDPGYGLIELQGRRMRFGELGQQLEALAARYPQGPARNNLLGQAAQAYSTIGDAAGLERVFREIPESTQYLKLIAQGDPSKLLRWAGQRNDAVDLAIASGDAGVALQAVAARGRTLPPVWGRAFTALTSLYYWNAAPDATAVFRAVLGTGTVGERLGKPVDRDRQLAGEEWFYYGARFGEYLSLKSSAGADDYLFAALEQRPGRSGAYSELGDWYVERSQGGKALTEYEHALELAPDRGEVHDRIATVLWEAGRHDEATAHWRLSLGAFEAQQGRPNLEESFWTNAPAALEHIGERGLAAAFRGEVDSLLRKYVERHSDYRVDALLRPVAKYRLVDFAAEPLAVLEPLSRIDLLSAQERLAIVRRMIQLGTNEEWRIAQWRQQEVALLLDLGDAAGARTAFAALKGVRNPVLEIRVYAAGGQLDALFERYRQHPEDAPSMRELRRAAEELANRQDDATADRVLEFAYARELDRGNFDASNFLGLAQIRLQRGELAPAMDLLRRVQMVSGEPFENLMPAADLLEKYGHAAEAAGFVAQRARAVPWDAAAKLRLGQDLGALVTDRNAPYEVRVGAAQRGARGGGGELDLLARGHITPAEASRPYFYDARLKAAADTTDAAARVELLLDAVAVRPGDDAPLLPLFRAALQAKRYELAREAASRVRSFPDLETARNAAALFERFEEYDRAEGVLRAAHAPAREIAELQHRAQVQRQNEARRPVVANGVEQDRVVRPRIEK